MSILLIDDSPTQRIGLSRVLAKEGFDNLLSAGSVQEALEHLRANENDIDLILSDIHMPELNGIDACHRIKAVEAWRDIPIIMVTTSDDTGDLQAAFEAGAIDYITKPPHRIELSARVRSALKLKYEMDRRKAREQELSDEQERSERLLLNILPQAVAERLKYAPNIIADRFEEATVLFADIVGFTPFAANHPPEEVVEVLNQIFSAFDALAETHSLEKIKTIGDSYMIVAGVPTPRPDHVQAVADMALDMRNTLDNLTNAPLQLRIGIHTGPVVAGVIGTKKFSYDLWGDTVNLASRMESHGCPDYIHVTEAVYVHLQKDYVLAAREPVEIKGRGLMSTYLLIDKKR